VRAATWLLIAALPFVNRECEKPPGARDVSTKPGGSTPPEAAPGPIRVEALEGMDPPVFVLRGEALGPGKLVFLHGMCGHGLGYAQSFQRAAAKRGTLIAPQADVPCGDGPWARWSKDIAALDQRIHSAFRALGHAEPLEDVTVIGYSQGATRAESLAREYPQVYTRLVLMGGPYAANPRGLETLRAAVAMAGARDRLDLMQASAKSLARAGVPATFLLIPEATHGSMGPHPEETMDQMLTWLSENERPRSR
jgi:pimeloyl-ACP methyl ester carboxylesterase